MNAVLIPEIHWIYCYISHTFVKLFIAEREPMLNLYATASLDLQSEDEIRLACSLCRPPRIIMSYCRLVFTSQTQAIGSLSN